jgi:hypothetical protein
MIDLFLPCQADASNEAHSNVDHFFVDSWTMGIRGRTLEQYRRILGEYLL